MKEGGGVMEKNEDVWVPLATVVDDIRSTRSSRKMEVVEGGRSLGESFKGQAGFGSASQD